MKVFKNKYDRWETLCQNHLLNGETIKYYMSVQFQRGFEPSKDSIDIEPIRWWMSAYMTKDQNVKPKIFIADWREIIEELKENTVYTKDVKTEEVFDEPKTEETSFEFTYAEDELPFY